MAWYRWTTKLTYQNHETYQTLAAVRFRYEFFATWKTFDIYSTILMKILSKILLFSIAMFS